MIIVNEIRTRDPSIVARSECRVTPANDGGFVVEIELNLQGYIRVPVTTVTVSGEMIRESATRWLMVRHPDFRPHARALMVKP